MPFSLNYKLSCFHLFPWFPLNYAPFQTKCFLILALLVLQPQSAAHSAACWWRVATPCTPRHSQLARSGWPRWSKGRPRCCFQARNTSREAGHQVAHARVNKRSPNLHKWNHSHLAGADVSQDKCYLGEKTSSNWMGATNWVTGITLWEKCVLNGNIHKSCDFPFVVIVWFPDAIYIVYIYIHIYSMPQEKRL